MDGGATAGEVFLHHNASEGGTVNSTPPVAGDRHHLSEGYLAVQQTPEFAALRRRFRGWVFPVTLLFLVWYFLYVLLAVFAPDFLSHTVVGWLNVGLLLGLGQFVSTFVITMLYARWADQKFDAEADRLAADVLGHRADGGAA